MHSMLIISESDKLKEAKEREELGNLLWTNAGTSVIRIQLGCHAESIRKA